MAKRALRTVFVIIVLVSFLSVSHPIPARAALVVEDTFSGGYQPSLWSVLQPGEVPILTSFGIKDINLGNFPGNDPGELVLGYVGSTPIPADFVMAVDVRINTRASGMVFFCGQEGAHYVTMLMKSSGYAGLTWGPPDSQGLAQFALFNNWDRTPGVHHLELDCIGTTVTLKEDGNALGLVDTGTAYTSPHSEVPGFGVTFAFGGGDSEFANLMLCDAGGCPPTTNDRPIITPTITGTVGSNSWYTSDVGVNWSLTDPGSGIASSSNCDPMTLTADTAGTVLTCSATNGAGFSSSAMVMIKVDKTPPTVTCTSPAPTFLQNQSGALVSASVSDSTSGSAVPTITTPVDTSSLGTFSVNLTGSDNAGNSATQGCPYIVANTPVGSNVEVALPNATTTFSSVASPGITTLSFGSSAPSSPAGFTVGNPPTYYDISTTATYAPPVTSCFAYDPSQFSDLNPARLLHYENNTWVDVTTSNDTTNHIVCGQTNSLSPFVVAKKDFRFLGFYPPVDNPPTINIAKAGQAIPIKWALQNDAGNYVSNLASVVSYGYGSLSSCSGTTDSITEYMSAGSTSLLYDSTANQFILISKTDSSWAGSCKMFTLMLSDGTAHQAIFQFK